MRVVATELAPLGSPEEWYVTAKEELAEAPDPQATVPTVELGGTCELVSSVEIAGVQPSRTAPVRPPSTVLGPVTSVSSPTPRWTS